MSNLLEYLQSPEGLQMTAFVLSMIILTAFIAGAHPFKRKKRLVVTSQSPSTEWYARECYMFLRATIITCTTPDELKKCRDQVEIFYDRKFRTPISTRDRKRYYARLLEAISLKEQLMNQLTPA